MEAYRSSAFSKEQEKQEGKSRSVTDVTHIMLLTPNQLPNGNAKNSILFSLGKFQTKAKQN